MKNDFVCQEKGRQHHSARPKTENILWLGYPNDVLTSSRSSTCAIVTPEISKLWLGFPNDILMSSTSTSSNCDL